MSVKRRDLVRYLEENSFWYPNHLSLINVLIYFLRTGDNLKKVLSPFILINQ
jgi:hypothetical protein